MDGLCLPLRNAKFCMHVRPFCLIQLETKFTCNWRKQKLAPNLLAAFMASSLCLDINQCGCLCQKCHGMTVGGSPLWFLMVLMVQRVVKKRLNMCMKTQKGKKMRSTDVLKN